MAEAVRARLTPAEGRKFGLTVGTAFLVLAALSRWRGHSTAPVVLAALGGVLLLAGLLLPARLDPVYRTWMRFGLALSRLTTPIFMGLLYFVILTPTGLVMRLAGRHPLKVRETRGSFWLRRPARKDADESLTRQF